MTPARELIRVVLDWVGAVFDLVVRVLDTVLGGACILILGDPDP